MEITESVMIADTGAALETLEELKSLGVCISLDDFGTGFSSLSSVSRFPFDKLKIDQSFIRDLGCVHDSLPIVQAVAEMCARMVERLFKLKAVADQFYARISKRPTV